MSTWLQLWFLQSQSRLQMQFFAAVNNRGISVVTVWGKKDRMLGNSVSPVWWSWCKETVIDPSLNAIILRNGRRLSIASDVALMVSSGLWNQQQLQHLVKTNVDFKKTFGRLGLTSPEFTILLVMFVSAGKTRLTFLGGDYINICRAKLSSEKTRVIRS